MSTTRAITSGQSQTIRLPKEYHLPNEDIFVNRIGNTITHTPVSKLRETFIQGLQMFTDDFMADVRPPQVETKRDNKIIFPYILSKAFSYQKPSP